jgi:hypothetical protein
VPGGSLAEDILAERTQFLPETVNFFAAARSTSQADKTSCASLSALRCLPHRI